MGVPGPPTQRSNGQPGCQCLTANSQRTSAKSTTHRNKAEAPQHGGASFPDSPKPSRKGQSMLQSYTTIDQLSTPNGGRTLREKCPVHGGKKKSVAVWWNNGPRAYCHSHQCSQTEILAGLGITSSQPFAWTPPPPPRLRSTISAKPLLPVTPIQGRAYLAGIPANRREWIQYQRQDGLLGWHWRQGSDHGIRNIADFIAISGTKSHRRTRIDTQY